MSSSPSEGHENIARRWKELKGIDVMRIPPERGCSLLSPTVGGVFHLPCSVFRLHRSAWKFVYLSIFEDFTEGSIAGRRGCFFRDDAT